MPGLKHFPDKPIERGPEDLADLDNGDYICQQKSDGWRLEVCKTLKGKTVLISRHNNVMNDQVEEPIRAEIERMLDIMPNRCQLDGEWLSRRQATNGKSEPRLILFDVVRYDGRWLLDEPYENRWSLLEILHFDGVSRRLMPANCAVATASKRGSFQMWLPSLCQDEAPRRFLGAMVRRQRVLHMSRTGGMRRRAASIPDTSKPLGLQPASATTTLQPCARPADYRANVAAIAIG